MAFVRQGIARSSSSIIPFGWADTKSTQLLLKTVLGQNDIERVDGFNIWHGTICLLVSARVAQVAFLPNLGCAVPMRR